MNLNRDDRRQANSLRSLANGTSLPLPLATAAVASDDARHSNISHATDKAIGHSTTPKMATSSFPEVGVSSPDSRIPLPTSTRSKPRSREPPSMKVALERAFQNYAQEQAPKIATERHRPIEGSPSPAPRSTRMGSSGPEVKSLHLMFSSQPIDLGRRSATPSRRAGTLSSSRDSFTSASRKGGADSDEEIDRKLEQFKLKQIDQDEKIIEALKEDKDASFVRPRAFSNGIGSTTPRSFRKPSAAQPGAASFDGGYLGSRSRDEPRSTWGEKATYDPNWLRQFQNQPDAAVAFHDRVSAPRKSSAEQDRVTAPARPATTGPFTQAEPFKWQVDDDFTAGDLQVSTSPPVNFGRPNTKLDELRKLEMDAARPNPIPSNLFAKRSNNRLEEIERLERETVQKYPVTNIEDSGPVAVADAQPIRDVHTSFWQPQVPTSSNHQSSRAPMSLHNMVPAAKTSGEPTEPRSLSPATQVKTSAEAPKPPSPKPIPEVEGDVPQEKNDTSPNGVKISNTPVEVFATDAYDSTRQQSNGVAPDRHNREPVKEDTRDLLRRLARASSRSPSRSPPQDKADDPSRKNQNVPPVPASQNEVAPIAKGARTKDANKAGSPSKPTVGFTGISRSSSTNSLKSRSSSVASHDPTARLEAEADLFALDTHSERGSFRVPSPLSDSESEDEDKKVVETPRPEKTDPLSMPTPRVTGAYVDTPLTVKVERREMSDDTKLTALKAAQSTQSAKPAQPAQPAQPIKDATETQDFSVSHKASKSDGQIGYMRRRERREARRSKSTPRQRSPLKNSAKLPSVKEDLWQICQNNAIDDSTLDDLTGLVMASSNPEELVNMLKTEELTPEIERSPEVQLERLTRIADGLRASRKGMEKLEQQVSHSEQQMKPRAKPLTTQHGHQHVAHDPACPECATSKPTDVVTYVHVPVPRLYRTRPKFKLTWTGFFMVLFCLWHMYWFVEDLFYDRWGKQAFCYRGSPCRWDVDDPEYGFVIPVKLDEWLTGGAVRPHASRWLEEAEDSWADFEDWWRGTNIQQVDHRTIRDSSKKAQYWRRIQKKGLFPKWNPSSWMLPQIEAWERESAAREEAEVRAAMGYDVWEEVGDERMDKDQAVRSESTDDESAGSWW